MRYFWRRESLPKLPCSWGMWQTFESNENSFWNKWRKQSKNREKQAFVEKVLSWDCNWVLGLSVSEWQRCSGAAVDRLSGATDSSFHSRLIDCVSHVSHVSGVSPAPVEAVVEDSVLARIQWDASHDLNTDFDCISWLSCLSQIRWHWHRCDRCANNNH